MHLAVIPHPVRYGLCLSLLAGSAALHAQPYGLPGPRQPVAPYLTMPAEPPQPSGDLRLTRAFPELEFSNLVFLTQAPRSSRLYACEREGRVWSFHNDPGTSSKTLVLDISDRTQGWNDCGLLSLAFHPEFGSAGSPNRGYFYVYYQFSETPVTGPGNPPATTPSFQRLSRFTIPDAQTVANRASELVLIEQHDRNLWHNGSAMFFHPDDRFLYFGIGDEGGAFDNYGVTQRIDDKLFSGIFRIDVDMRGGEVSHPIRRQPQSYPGRPSRTANYYIPSDNPWQDPAGGVLEEFFALGVRNPHRMSYDPYLQVILLGDVGQDLYEELNVVEKGRNYQWPFGEGEHPGARSRPAQVIGTEKGPLYEYRHGYGTFRGDCIIGGYIYRGTEHAASLGGDYLFADNSWGRVWAMDLDVTPPAVRLLTSVPGAGGTGISSFAIDAGGEVYVLNMSNPGAILKFTGEEVSGPAIPRFLGDTGAFANLATLEPASGLVPFDVASPLWSDGAHKRRWVAVPFAGGDPGAAELIQFHPTGEWTFPSGTVFVKHFELTVNEVTGERRRLETRLLVRTPGSGVYGVTYKWRPDASNAELLTSGLDEEIEVVTAEGVRTQTWRYPSSVQCLTCHNASAGHVLGLKTRQLNHPFLYPRSGVTDNQLRSLNHLGLFAPQLDEGEISGYDRLVAIGDQTAGLEHRVRSYLDVNCALCHRPGNVQAYFDARFSTPLAAQGLIDGAVGNPLGIDNAAVVRPQDIWRSVLHIRVASAEEGTRMPPLARNLPDAEALAVIGEWINSLPGTPALAPPAILPEEREFTDSVLVEITHPDPLATIRYTVDDLEPDAGSPSYEGPFFLTDGATVSARAYREGHVESVLATAEFKHALAGLQGEYFGDLELTDLRLTRIDPAVDFVWDESPDPSMPLDDFSVRWTGQVQAQFSEIHTFHTFSDDGIRLWVDGQLLVDNWTFHDPTEDTGQISLEAGHWYDVRLEFVEGGGAAVARLLWSSPSRPRQVIPARRLFSRQRLNPGDFVRGDGNGDGSIDLSDAIHQLLYTFEGSVTANCPDAMDADDNGRLEVTDALRILGHIFSGGPAPSPPYPGPGQDPTVDDLPGCGRGG
jgi:uncharacterized repeat protein (TIGR03806 family)